MDRKWVMRDTIALLGKTEGLFHRYLERVVSHTGVFPTQHRLLMELDRNHACSQMELAGKFGVSAAAIAVSLKKLEKGGYIERQTDRLDSRVNHVRITEKGKAVVSRSLLLFAETDEMFFEGFSDGELEQFAGFLRRAKENVERAEKKMEKTEKTEKKEGMKE